MKERIQQTAWLSNQQIKEKIKENGMDQRDYVQFIFSHFADVYYSTLPQNWAQEFLPNLFIGEVSAVFGHYDRESRFPKYDLIIDLSMERYEEIPQFSPASYHYRTFLPDNGGNFNEFKKFLKENNLFDKITTTLNENKKVLINCRIGMSRSATVAIYYLMETYGVSVIQAYRHLQTHRPIVEPNPGYIAALIEHEKTLNLEQTALESRAKAWLDEYLNIENLNLFKRIDKEEIILLKIKTREIIEGNPVWDLISLLKIAKIPFTLKKCTGSEANIKLFAPGYERLYNYFKNKTIESLPDQVSLNINAKIQPTELLMTWISYCTSPDKDYLKQFLDALKLSLDKFPVLNVNKKIILESLIIDFIEYNKQQDWEQSLEVLTEFLQTISKPKNFNTSWCKREFGQTASAVIFYQTLTPELTDFVKSLQIRVKLEYEDRVIEKNSLTVLDFC